MSTIDGSHENNLWVLEDSLAHIVENKREILAIICEDNLSSERATLHEKKLLEVSRLAKLLAEPIQAISYNISRHEADLELDKYDEQDMGNRETSNSIDLAPASNTRETKKRERSSTSSFFSKDMIWDPHSIDRASDEVIIHKGPLLKLPTHVRFMKDYDGDRDSGKWKKRFFALTKSSNGISLRYSESEESKIKGKIEMVDVLQVTSTPRWPNSIILTRNNGAGKTSSIFLKAIDSETQRSWQEKLSMVMEQKNESEIRESTVSHPSMDSRRKFDELAELNYVWSGIRNSGREKAIVEMKDSARAKQNNFKHLKPHKKITAHKEKITALAYGFDESEGERGRGLILSAAKEPRLLMWDVNQKKYISEINLENNGWTLACAISPSASLIAVGGLQEKVLFGSWRKQQHAGKEYPLSELGEHDGYVSSLYFHGGDNNTLVSGSGDSYIKIWDTGSKQMTNKFSHGADVLSVAGTLLDTHLILGGGSDLECTVHDIRTGEGLTKFTGAESDIEHVAFHPLDSNFFIGSSGDGVSRVYDRRKNGSTPIVETSQRDYGIKTAQFSLDGRWIYSATTQERFWVIYDAYTGETVQSVGIDQGGPNDAIESLIVARKLKDRQQESEMVFTGARDASIYGWDTQVSIPIESENLVYD